MAPNGRVRNPDDNFFASLHPESRQEILEGDGNELGTPDEAGKIFSLWSSTALACNVFDYWRERSVTPVLRALSLKGETYNSLRFEQQFPTGVRSARANLDVVFRGSGSACLPIAIESKFTEPYQSGNKACLRPSYFGNPQTWKGLPECRSLAEGLTTSIRFDFLDAGDGRESPLTYTKREPTSSQSALGMAGNHRSRTLSPQC